MAWTVDSSTLQYRTNGTRATVAERLERMKFYHMNYAASGSDGRFYAEILLAVDVAFCIAHEAWVRQAALVIGGHPMSLIMGVCPTEAWTLRPSTRERWEARATGGKDEFDGSAASIEALFLSDGPPIPGWPRPARLEDLQSGELLAAKVENRGRYGFRYITYVQTQAERTKVASTQ